jgi:hypothetical protein
MSGTSDKQFYKLFGYVSLFIILLGIIIAILANVFASSVINDNYDEIKEKSNLKNAYHHLKELILQVTLHLKLKLLKFHHQNQVKIFIILCACHVI